MARMLGTWQKAWCPSCRGPAGIDCPDASWSKKARRTWEKRDWRREVAAEREQPGDAA
jgi:hypothetical protein